MNRGPTPDFFLLSPLARGMILAFFRPRPKVRQADKSP